MSIANEIMYIKTLYNLSSTTGVVPWVSQISECKIIIFFGELLSLSSLKSQWDTQTPPKTNDSESSAKSYAKLPHFQGGLVSLTMFGTISLELHASQEVLGLSSNPN